MSLRSRTIRLAHAMPGAVRQALLGVLTAHEAVVKMARSMSVSQALGILGIAPSATPEEAKKAYRNLALQNHPDRGGDVQKMQDINAAYMAIEEAFQRGQMGGTPKAPRVNPKDLYQDLMKTFKRLKDGDVVEVVYAAKSSSSPDEKRNFVVEQLPNAAHNYIYMVPARRRANSQVAALIDYGDTLYFQATLSQQIRRVRSLKIVGQV